VRNFRAYTVAKCCREKACTLCCDHECCVSVYWFWYHCLI